MKVEVVHEAVVALVAAVHVVAIRMEAAVAVGFQAVLVQVIQVQVQAEDGSAVQVQINPALVPTHIQLVQQLAGKHQRHRQTRTIPALAPILIQLVQKLAGKHQLHHQTHTTLAAPTRAVAI